MAYEPRVYKTSGGDEIVVSTGGRMNITGGVLAISGTAFITSGGNIALGSLTSGNINTTGSITASSGINGSSGTFTNGISGSSAAITNGITGSSLAITNGITGSSLAITNGITGSSLAITNGITGSSLAITNGITGSSVSLTNGIAASTGTFTGGIALTSGISGTTGGFSGAVTVGATLTGSSGFVRAFENMATGTATLASVGVSIVWSSAPGSSSGHRWNLPASTAAGIEKWLVCSDSTQTGPAYVSTTSGGSLIDASIGGIIFSTGSVNRQWVHLLAENTTNWIILSRSTDMLLSTT